MSIRKKWFLIFGGFMLFMVVILIYMDTMFLKSYYIRKNEAIMREVGSEIVKSYNNDINNVKQYIQDTDETWNFTIRIAKKNGKLLFDTRQHTNRKGKLSDTIMNLITENQEKLESGKEVIYVNSQKKSGISRIIYILQMEDVYLVIQKSLNSIERNIEITNRFFIICGSILILVGFVVIYLVTGKMTKKIIKISQSAEKIAQLDFSEPVEITTKDEMGALAKSINEMSIQLDANISALQEDIGKRKQLVRDMAHELKTPVAAVKGYAEGLKFGVAKDPEKMQEYCMVIVNECDRMNDLIKEMLLLAESDTQEGHTVTYTVFHMKEIVAALESRFYMEIQEKRIKFQIVYDQEDDRICADQEMLLRALSNYMDNAIRYCPMGGNLRLTVEKKEESVYFRVYNDGNWIPEEEQDKLWDAFYRTDQSRNRGDSKNYGIGLAIVRAIAKAHGGDVFVENQDMGVAFGIRIPARSLSEK